MARALLAAALLLAAPPPLAQGAANVRDFGAAADGTTDDTAAVQAAIDNVTNSGGGVVLFPAGQYNLSQVHVGGACSYTTGPCDYHEGGPGDYVILRGEGRSTRLLLRGGEPPPKCVPCSAVPRPPLR